MKNIIKIALFLITIIGGTQLANAQVTTQDTVCLGATGKIYTVNGSTGSTYNWIITNGTKATGGTSDSITVNWNSTGSTGRVRVIERNAAGCDGDTVTMNVILVPSATGKLEGADSICFNKIPNANKLKVTFTGTAPFSYVWNNGATNATISGLAAGNYLATISDANGCVTTTSVTVANSSGSLSTSATTTNATCIAADGSATVSANGGTAPFSFAWNNGQTSATANALSAGSYSVTVTDANGCVSTANATVNASNGGLSASASTSNAICTSATGTATATASNGTAPYNFLWNNGASTSSLNNLLPGNYSVTAVDANGCIATANATVGSSTGNLSATASSTDVTTNGGNNGSVDITVSGGTAPFGFAWSNGATTEDLAAVVAGTYTVTITDANGCAITQSATVNQPPVAIELTANNWSATIFPNPTENQSMVSVELGTTANVRIRLINSLGQIIQSSEYSDVMNVQHSLNVSELPAAIYMVEIKADGIQKTQRLVVTRK